MGASKPNKWISKMQGWDGAVRKDYNPFAHVLTSQSPSLNFTFGRSHGLPKGYTMVAYGPPKGGKSVVANSFIGQLHADDPDGIALKYDSEFREELQNASLNTNESIFGIDPMRYQAFSINTPDGIFDKIETDVSAMCDEGAPIRLIIIDSINQIQGRRQMNNTSVMQQTIGDLALTLQEGFKRILPVQRKHRFGLIVTAHVRAEMDLQEQMRGNKTKMGASYGVQHIAEYFLLVQPVFSKEGNKDELGNAFEDESKKDMLDKAEKTAHKIRVCMKGNSAQGSAAGRVGEFTFDYKRGIVSQYEEVFNLGVNRGIIHRPNNLSYVFGDKKWNGKPSFLAALKDDLAMQRALQKVLREEDMKGKLAILADERAQQARNEAIDAGEVEVAPATEAVL